MPTLRLRGNPATYFRQMALAVKAFPQKVRMDAARRLRTRWLARIRLQFVQGRDPDGRRWRLPVDGHRPAMRRTGDLEKGYRVAIVPSGTGLSIRFENVMSYAEHLQTGTSTMKPRKQVPDGTLPDEWAEDAHVSYQEAADVWYARLKR